MKENLYTFDNNEHMEDAIACITSTAEQIASFNFGTSACTNEETSKMFLLRPKQATTLATEMAQLKRYWKSQKKEFTLAPLTTGRRSVLAIKASVAPDKELQ